MKREIINFMVEKYFSRDVEAVTFKSNYVLKDIMLFKSMNKFNSFVFEDDENSKWIKSYTASISDLRNGENCYLYHELEGGEVIFIKFPAELVDYILLKNDIELEEKYQYYINDEEYSSSSVRYGFRAVRWAGAYRTAETIKTTFEEMLEWELSEKRMERAADVFLSDNFYDYQGVEYEVDFYSQVRNRIAHAMTEDVYIYKKCKLGFVYDYYDIREVYEGDCYSKIDKEKKVLLEATGYVMESDDNKFLYYYSEEEGCTNPNHRECFLKLGSKPFGVIIRKPETWVHQDWLDIIKKEVDKRGLTLFVYDF